MTKCPLTDTALVRPFLKWPGGKFRLVSVLQSYLPSRAVFVEPFVGAGALFLNTHYSEVIVNDINPDLMNVYQQIQKNGPKFILAAKKFFTPKYNHAKMYYQVRELFNQSSDPWERALHFLYLNRHGFNGLCRYNLRGAYNVPFGDYRHPYFPQAELSFFYHRSQKVKFYCEPYTALLKRYIAKKNLQNMVFYCDPPYAPLSKTANFTGYAAHRFTLADQQELAHYAKALAKKGAIVLISNHDTPFVRDIYKEAMIHRIEVTRTISCQGSTRQKVGEVIACFES